MTTIFMDGFYYPIEDAQFKYVDIGSSTEIVKEDSLLPGVDRRHNTPHLVLSDQNSMLRRNISGPGTDEIVIGFAYYSEEVLEGDPPEPVPISTEPVLSFFHNEIELGYLYFSNEHKIVVVVGENTFESSKATMGHTYWDYVEVKFKVHATEGQVIVKWNGMEYISESGIDTLTGII